MKKQSERINSKVTQPVHRNEHSSSRKPSFTDFLLTCPKLDNTVNPFQRQIEYPRELDLIKK